jgi:hypothetical protein
MQQFNVCYELYLNFINCISWWMYYLTLSTQRVVMLLPEKCELLWTPLNFILFLYSISVLHILRYWMNGGGDAQM